MHNILYKMFLFLFLFSSKLFPVKNGLTTSLLLFFENTKNLGRSEDAKRRKKEDGLRDVEIWFFTSFYQQQTVFAFSQIEV